MRRSQLDLRDWQPNPKLMSLRAYDFKKKQPEGEGQEARPDPLPPPSPPGFCQPATVRSCPKQRLAEAVRDLHPDDLKWKNLRLLIVNAVLEDADGNTTETSRRLELGRATIYRWQGG